MDDSLRICLISKQFPPGVGGAETYAYELANGLAELGHEVDVYTQWIDEPDEKVDTHENVTVYRIIKARRKLVTFETIWFSLKARRTIDFDTYDIVHGTLMPASTIAVTPFNDIDCPVIVTSHGTSIGEAKAVGLETPADYLLKFFFHPMNVVMDWVAGRDADKVIAISEHARDQFMHWYVFSSNKLTLIPHGVDVERFYPREGTHEAVDPEQTTVLYVGRLGARKGLDLAIRSFSELDSPDVEFLIVGTGRHESSLKELSRQLDVADQVRFLGYIPDNELPLLYSSADIFLLPSRYEGFGLVLLEAMACRTPVLGADAGGIPTAIDHGGAGFVFSRNRAEMTSAISKMITDDELRSAVNSTTAEQVESMSWESVVETVQELYQAEVAA